MLLRVCFCFQSNTRGTGSGRTWSQWCRLTGHRCATLQHGALLLSMRCTKGLSLPFFYYSFVWQSKQITLPGEPALAALSSQCVISQWHGTRISFFFEPHQNPQMTSWQENAKQTQILSFCFFFCGRAWQRLRASSHSPAPWSDPRSLRRTGAWHRGCEAARESDPDLDGCTRQHRRWVHRAYIIVYYRKISRNVSSPLVKMFFHLKIVGIKKVIWSTFH